MRSRRNWIWAAVIGVALVTSCGSQRIASQLAAPERMPGSAYSLGDTQLTGNDMETPFPKLSGSTGLIGVVEFDRACSTNAVCSMRPQIPVVGARVEASARGRLVGETTTTGPGWFALDLQPGDYTIDVVASNATCDSKTSLVPPHGVANVTFLCRH